MFYYYYYDCVSDVCVGVCAWHGVGVEDSGQFHGVDFLLSSLCEFLGLSSGYQACVARTKIFTH